MLYTSWVDRPSIDSRVQHQNSYLCVLGCQVLMVTITPGLLFFKKINQKVEARREFGYFTASHPIPPTWTTPQPSVSIAPPPTGHTPRRTRNATGSCLPGPPSGDRPSWSTNSRRPGHVILLPLMESPAIYIYNYILYISYIYSITVYVQYMYSIL